MTGALGTGQQEVVVPIRLEADKGNANVGRALSAEIDKLRKQAEKPIKFGGITGLSEGVEKEFKSATKLVGSSTKSLVESWKKEIQPLSNAVAQAYRDEAAAADQAATAKIAADNRFAKNRSAILRALDQPDKPPATAASAEKSPSGNSERLLKQAEADQKGRIKETAHGLAETAEEATKFAKAIATLSDAKPETIEKLAKSLEKFKAVFDVFKSGVDTLNGVNSAIKTMQGFAATAAVEQGLRAAATNGGHAAGAAEGAGIAGAAVLGEGGGLFAGLGAGGVLATGALVATAAVALHDGFKRLLNWTGILGGHFDTLGGTLDDWTRSVHESIRLEEQMDSQIEAAAGRAADQRQRGELTHAYYEGRERIRDAKKPLSDVTTLGREIQTADSKRMAAANAPLTTRGQDLSRRLDADFDRARERTDFETRYQQLRKETIAAEKVVDANAARSAQPHADVKMPNVHGGDWEDKRTGTQQSIDKQQSVHPIERPMGWVPRLMDATFGRAAAMTVGWWSGAGTERSMAALHRWRNNESGERLGPSPSMGPAAPDLHTQLAQQEAVLKLSIETRDVAKERTQQLTQHLELMHQQVDAANRQLIAAQQQVKAANDASIANKANLSLMSATKQGKIAEILHRINTGQKWTREDALVLRESNVMQGDIGRKANAKIAESLDPEFTKEFQAAGGDEDLDNAKEREREASESLSAAKASEQLASEEAASALELFQGWVDVVIGKQRDVETTKSQIGGHQDPSLDHDGKRPAGTQDAVKAASQAATDIKKAGAEFVAAITDVGNATIEQITNASAEARRQAQLIKGMHA